MNKNVAIQGELGSFHHAAAMRWYGNDVSVVPCASFQDVFVALKNGMAETAVIAIENSLFGSINEIYDLLLNNDFYITGEIPERIHQCLIGFDDIDPKEISHVYSHPVALGQCSQYLDNELPLAKKVENFDTAASVKYIKDRGDIKRAAIASKAAAKIYGMKIIKEDIQNNQTNFTRFLVLEKSHNKANSNKASLVIETSHRPGALFEVLNVFNDSNINLSKLQSRPIPGKLWRYMFYIDLEADYSLVKECIAKIEKLDVKVKLLGTYNKASETTDI